MKDLLRPLTIGNVTLPNNLVLSPMAGFSDLPFRILCRREGAGLVCTEMVAANAVERNVRATMVRMKTVAEERPVSIQVFGTDPEEVARATKRVAADCEVVGFNMGCPAWQIQRQGCGAALLDHPEKAQELVRAVKSATSKPLLVKMRLGNGGPTDAVAFARGLERAGADGLIVHGRTARQGYSGRADWTRIKEVKDALSVPVVGNGDVVDGPSAEVALRESGVDGLALGRATLGDAHVFRRVSAWLAEGVEVPAQAPEDRVAAFVEYLRLADGLGVSHAHVVCQAQTFTKGLPGAVRVRSRMNAKKSVADLVGLFEAYLAEQRGSAIPSLPP